MYWPFVVLASFYALAVLYFLWRRWAITHTPYAHAIQTATLALLVDGSTSLSGPQVTDHLSDNSVGEEYFLAGIFPMGDVVLRMHRLGWLAVEPVPGAESLDRKFFNSRFRITPAGLLRLNDLGTVAA